MRKVVLMIATSLDGFIADKDCGVDWLSGEDSEYQGDYSLGQFMETVIP